MRMEAAPPGCAFEMIVEDVFSLQEGRTMFVGEVGGTSRVIPPCECELLIDDTVRTRFRLDGEWIHPIPKTGWRSVSTSDRIDLDLVRNNKGRCKLRGLG